MVGRGTFIPIICFALASAPTTGAARYQAVQGQGSERLVYADFENPKGSTPISSRGGVVQLFAYQERSTLPSRFKGLEGSNPPAPELVRLSKDDPSRAIAFEYELLAPNQYAGVGVEVHGQPDRDGKPVSDDVSEYKNLMLQLYVTGVSSIRVEFISRGQGIKLSTGFPQLTFKVSPGFNTYRVPLKSLSQPSWVSERVAPKEVLKLLTSINVVAFCDRCVPTKGTIVIDNVAFEK